MSVSSGGPFNSRAKMGAGFVGGGPSPILNPRKMSFHNYSGSPLRSADSMFSTFSALSNDGYFDEEGDDIDKDDIIGEDDDVIIELALESAIKAGKSIVSLEETLIDEDDEDDEDDDKSEFEEITTVGSVGGMGWTGPLKSPDVSRKKWRQMMDIWKSGK